MFDYRDCENLGARALLVRFARAWRSCRLLAPPESAGTAVAAADVAAADG
jgi:hypothetical protein